MCLIISFIFTYLSYSFYEDGEITNAIINGVIALFFLGLMVRNILSVRKMKKKEEDKKED